MFEYGRVDVGIVEVIVNRVEEIEIIEVAPPPLSTKRPPRQLYIYVLLRSLSDGNSFGKGSKISSKLRMRKLQLRMRKRTQMIIHAEVQYGRSPDVNVFQCSQSYISENAVNVNVPQEDVLEIC
ncbi:hypothetical protein Dimus_029314 [Dionaea muscipula]